MTVIKSKDLHRNFRRVAEITDSSRAVFITHRNRRLAVISEEDYREMYPEESYPERYHAWNAEMLAEMDAELKEMELHPERYKTYSSVEDLFADLYNDDEDNG